jgi:hypothetical protein
MAWTDIPSQNHQRIAIKRLRDLPGVMPIICEKEYFRASVCDWSEDGNLILANVTDDNWQTSLVLFDKNGKLVRTLPTAVAPLSGTPVSWRKYGHR